MREESRRRVLELAGTASIALLAGCSGSTAGSKTTTEATTDGGEGGEGGEGSEGGEKPWESLSGVSEDQFTHGPVPDQYKTATSLGGETRNPDQLVSKSEVQYQEADAAVKAGLATEGNRCENCSEYIPDKNDDGFGACLKVEGYIAPDDWCTIYEPADGSSS